MAFLTIFGPCEAGNHAACPRTMGCRPGVYGESVCKCECHNNRTPMNPTDPNPLSPCPFCGNDDLILFNAPGRTPRVQCPKHGELCLPLAQWNTRAPSAELTQAQAEAAAMRELLAALKADYDHPWPNEDEGTEIHRKKFLVSIHFTLESATAGKDLLEQLRHGVQEVVTHPEEEGLLSSEDEMKPAFRIRYYCDPGDREVGVSGWSAWVLASDQTGTILADVVAERDAANALVDRLKEAIHDGYAVYSALSEPAKRRTSAENVSDVLDALAEIAKALSPRTTENTKPQ